VYFISGSEHEISNMKCQHYPANGFLVKPVILDELTMIMDDIRKNGKNSPIK
jgi:hypothetical protein